MDTFTSFLAGITIFSILGNLAHESGKNVSDVVSAGTGLAFVSYPDAIAKFQYVPQVCWSTHKFVSGSRFSFIQFELFAMEKVLCRHVFPDVAHTWHRKCCVLDGLRCYHHLR